ncbi:hypothetical protein CEE35_10285 [Candidatus Aerophobetes bacterium Ae_b3b]|nr:MAG: hypothetical protein CEE35_10285 [Candidatus Aerophobetes bacterium Ae_b3b]
MSFSSSTRSSYLPRGSRDNCRATTAYFLRSDWDLLARISQYAGRLRAELVREAVAEYTKNSVH